MSMVPVHAERVAKNLGVGFIRDKKQPLWTGSAVNLAHAFNDKVYTPSNVILHELAHYVVAPKKYRGQPNFGWYDTPGGPNVDANKGAKDRMLEEKVAQVLTYLAMRHLGLDWERACGSDGWAPAEVLRFGASLGAKGLVDPLSLRPYFMDGKIIQ